MKKYKMEFHVHTSISNDSFLTKKFLFLMCKLKKIDCIAITDHNEIDNAIKYKEYFEKRGIKVIVGEEIFSKDGEIIGLYLNKKINPNLSAIETIEEIKKQNGLVYVPHPYDEKRYKTVLKKDVLIKVKDQIDFIECHNGRNVSEQYSDIQNSIADEMNIVKIVGSDAHTFYEIGRNYCKVSSLKREDLINEIKDAKFIKKKCIKYAHFNTKIVKLLKMIKGGKWNELSRIINKRFRRSR